MKKVLVISGHQKLIDDLQENLRIPAQLFFSDKINDCCLQIASARFDLVIVHIGSCCGVNVESIQGIKSIRNDVIILGIADSDDVNYLQDIKRRGALEVLPKNFSTEHLVDRILKIL